MPSVNHISDHNANLDGSDSEDSLFSTGSHHFTDDRDDQTLLPLTQHANTSSTSVFSFETIPMIPLSQTQARGPELQKKVSFINGLGLVVGLMIGSGLFSSPGNKMRKKEKEEIYLQFILTKKKGLFWNLLDPMVQPLLYGLYQVYWLYVVPCAMLS
jgi:hypothetical protein